MVFGQWSDSRHFLYFSVFLVLPQYETVQFLPPLPEVGKQGSSVLMFHEASYQRFIVRFILLKEVFPSLVCARAKSELSNHSVFLSTLAHMWVVESTLNRVVKPWHIAIWCSNSRLCNFTGAPPRSTLVGALKSLSFAHSYSVVRSLCSLFWSKAFPALRAPPLRMMAVRIQWITTVHFRLLPTIWCHLSLTLSLWTTTPPISCPSPV